MTLLDWSILLGTLLAIVLYGTWKTRGSKNIEGYLLGDKSMKWWTIGLSVMATQASAITFLSTPGQAYQDGMGFIQFYFGLPIAMVILCVTFIPIYYKLKVYTAYEFLEGRFDLKTRTLTAMLFLLQRGLAAGITIYAPAIILSSILGWDLNLTNIFIGVLVIIYTVSGGTKAVSQTQKQQMFVIMAGMFAAFFILLDRMPDEHSFSSILQTAGKMGKMEVVDLNFDLSDRYNLWSGLTGGLFLALSYFGTDQSQVARYLTASSIKQSRLGLLFNGLLKIPMQFFILLVGVFVFMFYQFTAPPVFFDTNKWEAVAQQEQFKNDHNQIEIDHHKLFEQKREAVDQLMTAFDNNDEAAIAPLTEQVTKLQTEEQVIRDKAKELIAKADPEAETKDTDRVFITFVMDHLPHGLIGLLLAVIFSAAMSSTSSEINALASTSMVDIYKRSLAPDMSDGHYLNMSKALTVFWGVLAIGFASVASLFENLIQLVNILGSLFYGTILGIFLVAFYFKRVKGNAVFIAALIAEGLVLTLFKFTDIQYLWFNVIGCAVVIIIAYLLSLFQTKEA